MASPADDRTWYIIPCPSSVSLTKVDKERGTHGSIYVLWDIDEKSPVWVGQSIPALVRSVNEKAVINKEKRLHASSLYRCLRGEARKQHHKSWKVDKYSRDALTEMNTFLAEFPSVVYVSKSPELWRCSQQKDQNEEVAKPTEIEVPEPPTPTEGSVIPTQTDASCGTSPQVGHRIVINGPPMHPRTIPPNHGGSAEEIQAPGTPPMPDASTSMFGTSVLFKSNSDIMMFTED